MRVLAAARGGRQRQALLEAPAARGGGCPAGCPAKADITSVPRDGRARVRGASRRSERKRGRGSAALVMLAKAVMLTKAQLARRAAAGARGACAAAATASCKGATAAAAAPGVRAGHVAAPVCCGRGRGRG